MVDVLELSGFIKGDVG